MQSPDAHPAPETEYPAAKALGVKSGRWVMAALLAACAAIVVAFVLLRPARPVPFVILHGPFHFPASFRDWVEKYIPNKASWGWAWKMEQRVFGNRKPVLIKANVVSLTNSPPTLLSNLALGSPNFSDTNGLCIWLLSSNQLRSLRRNLERMPGAQAVSAPRISSAEGIEASMYVGQTFPSGNSQKRVGLEFDCCARFRRDSSDFLTHITYSELVTNENDGSQGYGSYGYAPPFTVTLQTNIDTALRLQLPKGNGFFLLDQSRHESSRKNIGVLIDPL